MLTEMPRRVVPLVNDHYYHVLNRGVEKRNIFHDDRDRTRFLEMLDYYRYLGPKPSFSKVGSEQIQDFQGNEKLIEINCFCLMPNHFHLLIKQLKDGGISEFMRKTSDGYTRYFNLRHDRIGPLFQGAYKAVLIEKDEQLMHVSRYIHLNPLVSFLTGDLNSFKWSSFPIYLGLQQNDLVNKKEISGFFKDGESYKNFVLDQADYAIKLEQIKHALLD